MVGHAVDVVGAEGFEAALTHAGEGLRTGHLVHVQAVDIQLVGAILDVLHHVAVPDFVEECVHGGIGIGVFFSVKERRWRDGDYSAQNDR